MIHWFCSSCRTIVFGRVDDDYGKVCDRLDSLESNSIRILSEQVEEMAKGISNHVRLVNRILHNQEEVAINQENLLKRSFCELHEEKESYANIVKGSCEKAVKDISMQFDDMKNQREKRPTFFFFFLCPANPA